MGTTDRTPARKRVGHVLTAAGAAVVLALGGSVATAGAWAASGADTDGIPGACIPGNCPDVLPSNNHNGPLVFEDNGINVFVGGDLTVTDGATEGEGRWIVRGDASYVLEKPYWLGIGGVGSRIVPSDGSAVLQVGGSITAAQPVVVSDNPNYAYDVVHGGTTDPANVDLTQGGGRFIQDEGIASAYADALTNLSATSAELGELPDTGVATAADGILTLHGDGSSALQVFTLPAGSHYLAAPTGIPADATILINVQGTGVAVIDISNVDPAIWNDLGEFSARVLWNVPEATTVTVAGGQVPGSLMVGNVDSSTKITANGTNGRIFVAGDLTQAGAAGSEIHAYPFEGELPTDATQDPIAEPTIDPTDEPTSDPAVDPRPDPAVDPTSEPTLDPAVDPRPDPTADPTSEPSPDPAVDPRPDPAVDPRPDPTADPTADPTSEPTPDPSIDPRPDPTADPSSGPMPDPAPEPTGAPTADPLAEPTAEPSVDTPADIPQLPVTGSSTLALVAVALLLVGGGAALRAVARRHSA